MAEGSGYNGGISNYGDFKEGFCLKVITESELTWLLCVPTKKDKENLMLQLKLVKLRSQRELGTSVYRQGEDPNDPKNLQDILNPKPVDFTIKNSKDGYWVMLQDWTQCSLTCGGGISTLQRMCMPPSNGGKPCEGEAVLTKPCNIKPCPKVEYNEALRNNRSNTVLKPIIKVMPITLKKPRYKTCIIKEGDLLISNQDPNKTISELDYEEKKGIPPPQMPVRIVMNNRTITIYENAEDYSSHFKSFELAKTEFNISKRDKQCFKLIEGKKEAELCPIMPCEKTVLEWSEHFNLFKFNCETKPDVLEDAMTKILDDKIQKAKTEAMAERQQQIKEKTRKDEVQDEMKVVQKVTNLAQTALIKEQNLESLLEQEELEQEDLANRELKEQIEKEKNKNV